MIDVVENKISVIAEKLQQIEIEISKLEGSFNLFALIEREDSLGKWDLVISAEWIGTNQKQIIDMIAFRISNKLDKNEQLKLSRILILSPSDQFVQNLNLIHIEHGKTRLSNTTINGVVIREALLITSQITKEQASVRPKK